MANIRWIIEKVRECQKNIYFCFNDYAKAFNCVYHNKLWEILKRDGPYGRRRGWDDLREQHRNMYIIKCETDRQSRLDAQDKSSGLGDDPEGWGGEGGGKGVQDGEHM